MMSLELSTMRLSRKTKRLLIIAWVAAVLAGYLALQILLTREYERDTRRWEAELGLVASAHSRAVGGWVRDRLSAASGLADNVSLRLYLTELTMSGGAGENDSGTEPAELSYLRNLLIASARFGGFDEQSPAVPNIPASFPAEQGGGLLLTTADLRPVASTFAMPPLDALPETFRHLTDAQKQQLSAPFEIADGRVALALRTPVFGVQQDNTAPPIGYVFAVTVPGEEFFDLLRGIGVEEENAESFLMFAQGTTLTVFSPLADGSRPMERVLDAASALAPAAAYRLPGLLISSTDFVGRPVFAVARPVAGTPWRLVRMIDQSLALDETHSRARFLRIAYTLAAGFLTAGLIALWRHATALRARQVAAHYKALSHRIQKQEALLELIAETTPIATSIVDSGGHYLYANRCVAEEAGMSRADIPGKALGSVLGSHRARALQAANEASLADRQTQQLMVREEGEGGVLRQVRQSRHIPLAAVPLGEEETTTPGVLMIEQDITDVVRGEERRARILEQLIETLVAIMDKRDPHAAEHSACVAMVAREVARQMRLDDRLVKTAEIAGRLMNIGKITVPENVLTARDSLKDADRARIRASLEASADLLSGIDFDGPVVETLREALGASQELPAARIIVAVNDFVAMISPRAWRGRLGMDQAIAEIMTHVGSRYDRGVVAALVNYLDNAGGRAEVTARLRIASR